MAYRQFAPLEGQSRRPRHFEKDVFPVIGEMQITEISVSDVEAVISAIIARGATVTAEKVRQWIGAVHQYAAMLEITDRNPAAVLRGHFEQAKTDHRSALPREELTEFFCRLIRAEIEPQNRIALILNMLTFLRSTELRGGQWNEIDFDVAMWTVPAQRMKHEKTAPKPPHAVPLADWTLELLAELKEITGRDLCKKAFPPTAETQTQIFGCFRFPQYLLILPKYPLNPPLIPDNQASGPPFRRQQAHLAC